MELTSEGSAETTELTADGLRTEAGLVPMAAMALVQAAEEGSATQTCRLIGRALAPPAAKQAWTLTRVVKSRQGWKPDPPPAVTQASCSVAVNRSAQMANGLLEGQTVNRVMSVSRLTCVQPVVEAGAAPDVVLLVVFDEPVDEPEVLDDDGLEVFAAPEEGDDAVLAVSVVLVELDGLDELDTVVGAELDEFDAVVGTKEPLDVEFAVVEAVDVGLKVVKVVELETAEEVEDAAAELLVLVGKGQGKTRHCQHSCSALWRSGSNTHPAQPGGRLGCNWRQR